MGEQQIVAQTEKDYPFRFFVEDRHSDLEVLQYVAELYQIMVESSGMCDVPSLGGMAHRFVMEFNYESIARIVYVGDYESADDDVGMYSSFAEHIMEEYGESEESADNFIEEIFSRCEMFPMNVTYRENFIADLRYALETLGLFFIDAEHTADMFRMEFFKKDLPPISSVLVNCPIVEVW